MTSGGVGMTVPVTVRVPAMSVPGTPVMVAWRVRVVFAVGAAIVTIGPERGGNEMVGGTLVCLALPNGVTLPFPG